MTGFNLRMSAGGKPTKGPNKSLGQHWLHDRAILDNIALAADIQEGDFVLEIGPGLGTLTSSLLKAAGTTGQVFAVEFDENLASKLSGQFPGKNLEVIHDDFLQFNLDRLPKNYKVAANVPYYITSKIIEKLLTAHNQPSQAALLVQKEVAQRIVAEPGDLSILAISAQIYAEVELGEVVPAEFFTPPPKVDSQVIILKTREQDLISQFNTKNEQRITEKDFFRVVKAGFMAKRKKIIKSLSGNLAIEKDTIDKVLKKCNISSDLRAQDLPIDAWLEITLQLVDYL